jgi:hypothetical protein
LNIRNDIRCTHIFKKKTVWYVGVNLPSLFPQSGSCELSGVYANAYKAGFNLLSLVNVLGSFGFVWLTTCGPLLEPPDALDAFLFFETTTPTTTPMMIKPSRDRTEPMTFLHVRATLFNLAGRTYNPS